VRSELFTADLLLSLPGSLRARRELAPLLYATLDAAGRLGALSDEQRAFGRRAWLGTLGRNSRILPRATEILDTAEQRGLRLMPLKGCYFVDALYGDPGLRGMVDIDLLVAPDDVEQACALIGSLGFRRTFEGRARFTPRHGHDVSFTAEDDPDLIVELHYSLFHELRGDASVEQLFARATRDHVLGRMRLCPSLDDHLFIVAVHAATHAFGDQAMWPFDLALLCARTRGIDRAYQEASRRGYRFAFQRALAIAHAALPKLLPPPPALSRTDRFRTSLLDTVLGDVLAAPPTRLRSLCARALLTERPTDAVREIARKTTLRLSELRGA
jgi:hypothetical protein